MIGKTRPRPRLAFRCPNSTSPHFRYGKKGSTAASASGDGKVGQPVSGRSGRPEGTKARPAVIAGDSISSKWMSRWRNWPRYWGKELELYQRIQPKGSGEYRPGKKSLYRESAPPAPRALRHFKRTYKRALRRQITSQYLQCPTTPLSCRSATIKRLSQSWKTGDPARDAQAVVILHDGYLRERWATSRKRLVRIESFWIDTWLRSRSTTAN